MLPFPQKLHPWGPGNIDYMSGLHQNWPNGSYTKTGLHQNWPNGSCVCQSCFMNNNRHEEKVHKEASSVTRYV